MALLPYQHMMCTRVQYGYMLYEWGVLHDRTARLRVVLSIHLSIPIAGCFSATSKVKYLFLFSEAPPTLYIATGGGVGKPVYNPLVQYFDGAPPSMSYPSIRCWSVCPLAHGATQAQSGFSIGHAIARDRGLTAVYDSKRTVFPLY